MAAAPEMSSSEGTEDSPWSPESSPPAVPQECRCQQEAPILLEQLQEEHNRTLVKLAEAENTIDRLRLEAKVNLSSDPLKPGYLVQPGLNKEASKVLMLDFPQAQRAEIDSASLPLNEEHQVSPSSRSPGPQVGQQLAQFLLSQADKLLQQLQTFKNLLKGKTLNPVAQTKLAEQLDSLKKSFLLTRDTHQLLQQQGAEFGPFDPEQELEAVIGQCGLGLKELREQEELTSLSLHQTSSSVASEGKETLTPPQDGVNSPEVDSGFIGSESSHLTPAAASRYLHQREPKSSVSEPQQKNSGRVTAPVHGRRAKPSPDWGQRRRRLSISPQRWSRAESRTSSAYDGSICSLSGSSSSPSACCRRGDPLRAPTSSQVADPRRPSSGVRGREEVRRTLSLSNVNLDRDLDRAIRAAQCMRSTSAHMVHTLRFSGPDLGN